MLAAYRFSEASCYQFTQKATESMLFTLFPLAAISNTFSISGFFFSLEITKYYLNLRFENLIFDHRAILDMFNVINMRFKEIQGTKQARLSIRFPLPSSHCL